MTVTKLCISGWGVLGLPLCPGLSLPFPSLPSLSLSLSQLGPCVLHMFRVTATIRAIIFNFRSSPL